MAVVKKGKGWYKLLERLNVHAGNPTVSWASNHHGDVTAIFVSHETCYEDEDGKGHKNVVVVGAAHSARMVFGVGLVAALLLLRLAVRGSGDSDSTTGASGSRFTFSSRLREQSSICVRLCSGSLDEDVK